MSETSTASRTSLYEATGSSLQSEPKELPPIWLYDELGSQLYEEITRLPDYYLPRREAEILDSHSAEIARRTDARTLVELGSGNSRNTRILLDALSATGTLERFAPVDVSAEMLHATARAISVTYPGISVDETVGDFERDLNDLPKDGPRLIALLGSTLGNLHPEQRAALLLALGEELAEADVLLLGLDLVKDVARLNAAYHDADGVTEAFVRNALTAVNRELDATFEQRRFVFKPEWDPENEWMDIGFRALDAHTVSVRGLELELAFESGERLRAEVSSKFRRKTFEPELTRAGLRVESWWADGWGDFAVVAARLP